MGRDIFGTYLTDEDYAIAEKNGVSKETVRGRLSYGFKAAEAISRPLKKDLYKEYAEMKALALKNGIKTSTFEGRVQNGWGLEAAACMPVMPRSQRGNMRKGIRILPLVLVEEAAKNGISRSTLTHRLRRGDTVDEAVRPLGTRKGRHIWDRENQLLFMPKQQRI